MTCSPDIFSHSSYFAFPFCGLAPNLALTLSSLDRSWPSFSTPFFCLPHMLIRLRINDTPMSLHVSVASLFVTIPLLDAAAAATATQPPQPVQPQAALTRSRTRDMSIQTACERVDAMSLRPRRHLPSSPHTVGMSART